MVSDESGSLRSIQNFNSLPVMHASGSGPIAQQGLLVDDAGVVVSLHDGSTLSI